MRWDTLEEEPCSLARTVAVIGDRWSLLILRECFLRIRRFEEFQSRLGITRHLLADRLKKFVRYGVLRRARYQDSPARYEYILTQRGLDLYPVVMSIVHWGDTHMVDERGRPLLHQHKNCGKNVRPGDGLLGMRRAASRQGSACAQRTRRRDISRGVAGSEAPRSGLVHLDAGRLDRLGPFRDVLHQQRAKLFRRTRKRRGSLLGEHFLKISLLQDLGDVGIDLADDRRAEPGRAENPPPGIDVEILDPASAIVGVSGETATRCALLTASARTNPCLNRPNDRWRACERRIQMATDHVGNRLRRSLVGHMRDTDVGLDLEHLAEQMIDRAVACRTVVQLVGIGPRQVEKLLQSLCLVLRADDRTGTASPRGWRSARNP